MTTCPAFNPVNMAKTVHRDRKIKTKTKPRLPKKTVDASINIGATSIMLPNRPLKAVIDSTVMQRKPTIAAFKMTSDTFERTK